MAMEALTYDRALAYKEEFPPNEYETWQPRKVMLVLLDIDPTADKDSSVGVGVEEVCDVAAMVSLGSEKVLNMSALRKHYDALGSYLHVQSMKQANAEKKLDFSKIRVRREEISTFVGQVLSSPVYNITIGTFATMNYMACDNAIRKRIPSGQNEVMAECYKCSATYTVLDKGVGKAEWEPHQHEIDCANDSCQQKIIVWKHEIEIGRCWTCTSCRGNNTFTLGVCHTEETQ